MLSASESQLSSFVEAGALVAELGFGTEAAEIVTADEVDDRTRSCD